MARLWVDFVRERIALRDSLRQFCVFGPTDKRVALWRRRVVQQNAMELEPSCQEMIVYPLVAFELSKGCSVGCNFCAVSAQPLTALFRATPENLDLWDAIIRILMEKLGPTFGPGAFCYWATDPLDNPDYEIFVKRFHRSTGYLPQTTTALAHKSIARTRALIQLNRDVGFLPDRFSVLSRNLLRLLHASFTPEELLEVELVTQNPESLRVMKIRAGRNYAAPVETGRHRGTYDNAGAIRGTIACVAGFLIKLVDAKIELISPCEASDEYPLGYCVHASRLFEGAAGFESALESLIEEEMPGGLALDVAVKLWSRLRSCPDEHGITLHGAHGTFAFSRGSPLAIAISSLDGSPVTIGRLLHDLGLTGIDPLTAAAAVQFLYEHGLIDKCRPTRAP